LDSKQLEIYQTFEFILAATIFYKSDVRLIIALDGSITWLDYSVPSNVTHSDYFSTSTHISIPIFEKLKIVWKKITNEEIIRNRIVFHRLEEAEQVILESLRAAKGQIDDVVITLRNQETPKGILVNKSIDPKTSESVCKYLRSLKNCSVTIAYGDTSGVPVGIREKKSIKISKRD
jgi:hypothetical protein